MNTPQPAAPAASMSANDIFYIVFRHKWMIAICTLVGLLAAGAFAYFMQPPYQSDAMLFIRYVTENSAPGLPGSGEAKPISLADLDRGGTILNTEVQILRSVDIAYQVTDAIGIDKVLPKNTSPKDRTRDNAAGTVAANLIVQPLPMSSVIHLAYQDNDPAIVQPVLKAIVDVYYKKHVEVHRQAGAIGDFLSRRPTNFVPGFNKPKMSCGRRRTRLGSFHSMIRKKSSVSRKNNSKGRSSARTPN